MNEATTKRPNRTANRTLNWKVRVVMADRGIRTSSELARRLNEYGIEISTQQINRIVNDMPARLSTAVLAGLVNVLDCTVADLFVVDTIGGEQPGPWSPVQFEHPHREPRTRTRHAKPSVEPDEIDITGPKVSPIPLPARKR